MKKLFLIITLSLLAESSYAWRCCQKGGGDAPGIFLTKKRCEKDGFDVKEGLNATCGSAAAGVFGMGSGIVSCASKSVDSIISMVESYASSKGEGSDKFIHCSTSCILKKRCGSVAAWAGGHAKEIKDLFDKKKANSYGSGDNIANQKGRQLAEVVTSDNGCLEKCGEAY